VGRRRLLLAVLLLAVGLSPHAGPARGQSGAPAVRGVIAASNPPVAPPAPPPSPIRQAVYQPDQEASMSSPWAASGPAGNGPAAPTPPPPPPPPPPPAGSAAGGLTGPPPEAAQAAGAALALEATGPPTVVPGAPLSCVVVARNVGAVTLARVEVVVPLPPNVRLLSTDPPTEPGGDRALWSIGPLAAGAERQLRLELQAAEPGEVCLSPTATFTPAEAVRTRVALPPLGVKVKGPTVSSTGAPVVFQIEVSNQGTTPLTQVVVRDDLPDGLMFPKGSRVETDPFPLAAGETRTIQLDAQAARPGRFVNEVAARAEGGLTAQAQAAVEVREALLGLRLLGPAQGEVGKELTYQLEATAPEGVAAAALRLTLAVPEGFEFLAASTGGTYAPSIRAVTWAVGDLAAGQRQTVTLRLRAIKAGEWRMETAAACANLKPAHTAQAVRLDAVPALSIRVTGPAEPVVAGAEATWAVHVLNQGSAAAVQVRLTAGLPDGLQPLAGDGPVAGRVAQQQVVFEALPQLAPRQEAVYRLRARVRGPADGRLRVEVASPSLPAPLVEEAPARVAAATSPQ
jgi:uncharacterized repeat protein (TIGR01451 family)